MNFSMVTKPVHFYGEQRTGAPKELVDCETRIRNADAYVVVSAEYNHSIPPGKVIRSQDCNKFIPCIHYNPS